MTQFVVMFFVGECMYAHRNMCQLCCCEIFVTNSCFYIIHNKLHIYKYNLRTSTHCSAHGRQPELLLCISEIYTVFPVQKRSLSQWISLPAGPLLPFNVSNAEGHLNKSKPIHEAVLIFFALL